jgi:WD40 repeat protein
VDKLTRNHDGFENAVPAYAGHRVAYPLSTSGEKEKVLVWDIKTGKKLALASGVGSLHWVVFNSDGSRLAGLRESQGVQDGAVVVWDAASGKELFSLPNLPNVTMDLQFSPDGSCLGTTFGGKPDKPSGTVRVWDAITGKEPLALPRGSHYGSLAFAPDGSRLAADSSASDGSVTIWDTATRKELLTLPPQSPEFNMLAFSADGSRLAVGGTDGLIAVWEIDPKRNTGAPRSVRLLKGHTSWTSQMAFTGDGQFLVSVPSNGSPRVWDLGQEDTRLVLPAHADDPHREALSFSPDGRRIGTAVQLQEADEVTMWNLAGTELWRKQVPRASTPEGATLAVFSPDGKRFAVSSSRFYPSWKAPQGRLTVWDAETGQELLVLQDLSAVVGMCAFGPDGKRIAFSRNVTHPEQATCASEVVVASADSGKELLSVLLPGSESWALAFSPDGRKVAAILGDESAKDGQEEVRVWDATTGQLLQTLGSFKGCRSSLTFSPDGGSIAVVPANCFASLEGGLWDVSSGKKHFTLGGAATLPAGVAFSPDGRRIVINGPAPRPGNWLRICDAESGRELLTLKEHQPIKAFAFSHDGSRIYSASGTADGKGIEIRTWDATPLPEKASK